MHRILVSYLCIYTTIFFPAFDNVSVPLKSSRGETKSISFMPKTDTSVHVSTNVLFLFSKSDNIHSFTIRLSDHIVSPNFFGLNFSTFNPVKYRNSTNIQLTRQFWYRNIFLREML